MTLDWIEQQVLAAGFHSTLHDGNIIVSRGGEEYPLAVVTPIPGTVDGLRVIAAVNVGIPLRHRIARTFSRKPTEPWREVEIVLSGARYVDPLAPFDRFRVEWSRIGLSGEPRLEADESASVAVEAWGVRVFFHPRWAAEVLEGFRDAHEIHDDAEGCVRQALREEPGAVLRSEPHDDGSGELAERPNDPSARR
jgi:hypothetical protein